MIADLQPIQIDLIAVVALELVLGPDPLLVSNRSVLDGQPPGQITTVDITTEAFDLILVREDK